MLKRRPKEIFPELLHPGDREIEPCSPGSIEQQLDMCEEGSLRGDAIEHRVADERTDLPDNSEDTPSVDREMEWYELDMAERDREGDEMSGDDHSSGLQGEETELAGQLHINRGVPGDRTKHQEIIERKVASEEGEL